MDDASVPPPKTYRFMTPAPQQRGRGFLVLIAVLLGILVLQNATPFFGDAEWEYTVVAPDDRSFESEMNALGAEGWEVVSARRASCGFDDDPCYELILKREK